MPDRTGRSRATRPGRRLLGPGFPHVLTEALGRRRGSSERAGPGPSDHAGPAWSESRPGGRAPAQDVPSR
ncbi:hypothetical protein GCM10019017_01000 [Streptomyces showdoensis]